MNRHAEKLVHATTASDEATVDPVLGGIIEEVHCCPACGATASRRVGESKGRA